MGWLLILADFRAHGLHKLHAFKNIAKGSTDVAVTKCVGHISGFRKNIAKGIDRCRCDGNNCGCGNNMTTGENTSNVKDDVFLDINQALRDVSGDRELLCELAVFIAEDAPMLCAEIASAVREKSSDLSRRLGHSLKSMAGQIRAEPTASLAAKIENLSKLQAWDEITPRLLNSLDESVAGMIVALRSEHLIK